MRKVTMSLIGAALAVTSFSTSASAVTNNLTYLGQNNGKANVTTTNTAAPSGSGTVSASSGPFTMQNNTAGGTFLAWCLDLYDYLASGNYTKLVGPFTGPNTGANPNPFSGAVGSPGLQAPVLSNAQLVDIENLFEANSTVVEDIYDNSNGKNNTDAAGFQLALWELIYEDASNGYDLTTGGFQSTPAGIAAAANGFLANLGKMGTQNYDLTFWEHNDGDHQNLVSITKNPNPIPPPVPLPAAGWLLIGGLAGLGALSRCKKKA